MNASGGGVSSDLTLFLRIWKMKCKLPLSCWTQVFTTHPFSPCFFPLCQLQNIFVVFLCFSPGSRGLDWFVWSGAAWNVGKGCSAWPKCAWSCSQRSSWKVGEHPFSSSPSPFLFFSCLLPKKGLDVGCWPITMWVSPQKKRRRRRMGGGGLCEYSETTEINRAEKNSGKKSARLRVKGFYCWFWVFKWVHGEAKLLSLQMTVWISKMGRGLCELEVEKIFVVFSSFNFLKTRKEVAWPCWRLNCVYSVLLRVRRRWIISWIWLSGCVPCPVVWSS